MLYCVNEVAYIFNVDRAWIYYHLRMYNISAIKVGDSWRITEQGVKDVYRLYTGRGIEETPGNNGPAGYTERLESVRAKYAANPARSPFTCVSHSRRGVAGAAGGLHNVAGRQARLRQPELFDDL